MKHLSRLQNQNGFTVISSIIAAGIATVVILGLGTVLTQMTKVMRGAETMGEGSDIVEQIRMNFQNPQMCDTALGGGFSFAANAAGGSETSLSGVALQIHGKSVTFTNGSEVAPGVVLNAIDLVTLTKSGEKETIALKGSGATPVDAFRYQGLIRVQLTRRTAGVSSQQAPSFIPVVFTTNSTGDTGTISNCGATAVSQSTCEALNYVWDTTAGNCIQANECSYGGSYSNTGGAVGSFTNPFTGGYGCPVDAQGVAYDAIRSGSISWAVKSGKFGVESNIYPVFSCMICKDANGKKATFNATTLSSIKNLAQGAEYQGELPAGSYSASCNNCTISKSGIMKCNCQSIAGTWYNSTLDTKSCTGDISNMNGGLKCAGACASKTGAGPGLANYACMCDGTAYCNDAYTFTWSGHTYNYPASCTEYCSSGWEYWTQTFNSDGSPQSAPNHYYDWSWWCPYC